MAKGSNKNPARDVDVITTHLNADFDALASMLAASKLYPGAMLVFPGAQERNLRNFFVESVSYYYNFAKVKQVPFERVRRLIITDTRQAERIGALAALAEDPAVKVICYDHHPDAEGDVKADQSVVKLWGSTTSLLVPILRERGLELSEDEATILALGIYEDTGSFTFVSTTPHDYQAAAWLLEKGANLALVSGLLTRELSVEQVGVLNDLINSLRRLSLGGVEVALAEVSRESYIDDLAVVVHKLVEIDNLAVVFVLARMEGRVYLIARSRLPEVDVGVVASALGGGGHPSAASASLKDLTLIEARSRLAQALGDSVGPTRLVGDLMSSPAIRVPPKTTLASAQRILTRYNINVLPVVAGGKVAGLITRQIVEKAAFHGLEKLPVADYMIPRVETVGPRASLEEVEKILVKRRQRLLPVMEAGKLVGVVTRTDLLHTLMERPLVKDSLERPVAGRTFLRHKNVASLVRERLPKDIVAVLLDLGEVADSLGYNAYLVGGSVRDLFLRRQNLDLDIVVEGHGIEFAKAYIARHPQVRLRTHEKFCTAKLIFPDQQEIDVATARLEYYHSPAALPVVELSSLKLDLYRRDFTINTLAVKLNQRHFGMLIDFFDGLSDLKSRAIRVLHNLSFVEDPTRVFRAVRFEQRFDFRIGKFTTGLIRNALKVGVVSKLSGYRLMGELKQMFGEESAGESIRRMQELGLLEVLRSGLKLGRHGGPFLERLEDTLAWYQLSYLDQPVRSWLLYLLVLCDSLDRQGLREVLERLDLSPKMREEIDQGRATARRALHRLQRMEHTGSQIYFALAPLKLEYQLYIMAKSRAESVKRAVSVYLTSLAGVSPTLGGKDLLTMGFTPGPQVGEILRRLLAARLDGEVKTPEQEAALVRDEFGEKLEKTA